MAEPAESVFAAPGIPHNPFRAEEFHLDWSKADLERRLGFRGGRFTSVNRWLTFLLGLVLTVAFYAFLIFGLQNLPGARGFTAMFLERGPTPYPTMLLFLWALSILFVKWKKLGLQAQALKLSPVPQEPGFQLNRETAPAILARIHGLVDGVGYFLLLNRIERALSNLHNIGQISDVATILRHQADYDEEHISSSYSLVHSFLWAIPVLGFIGTVLGLREAIGALGSTLQSGGDIDAIRHSLQAVTSGLSTKFETTLVALVCAVLLQLLLALMQNKESEFLDECNEYCHAHISSKLRLAEK